MTIRQTNTWIEGEYIEHPILRMDESFLHVGVDGPVIARHLDRHVLLPREFSNFYYGKIKEKFFHRIVWNIRHVCVAKSYPVIWCPRPRASDPDHSANVRYLQGRIIKDLRLSIKAPSVWDLEVERSRATLNLYMNLFNLNI